MAKCNFDADCDQARQLPQHLDEIPMADEPAMLESRGA
jgi:hypothetical protein